MDFDKQFGNNASAPVVMKGRGFTEVPDAEPAVNTNFNRARRAPKKVTSETQFVITNTRFNSRRQRMPDASNRRSSFGQRNGNRMMNQRGNRRFNNDRRDNRKGSRFNNRGQKRSGMNRDNRHKHAPTNSELDNALDKYFAKDPEIMNEKLDDELRAYMEQRNATNQGGQQTEANQAQMQ